MSSRVLIGTNVPAVRPHHWATAFGSAVNAEEPGEPAAEAAPAGEESAANPELEGALLRIQVLERRIQELEQELPKRQAAGHAEGLAEGKRTGMSEASAHWAPALENLTRSIAELATYRARFRREAEPELVKLSMGVAKKILRRELSIDPFSLLGVLKAALETMNQAEILEVRLSPEDAGTLAARIQELGMPAAVKVSGDATLIRGSVRIETKRGSVDAGIQTQLAEIEHGLTDRSNSRR